MLINVKLKYRFVSKGSRAANFVAIDLDGIWVLIWSLCSGIFRDERFIRASEESKTRSGVEDVKFHFRLVSVIHVMRFLLA